MNSAYASENKRVLGQLKAEQKSNKTTAISALLKMLDLRGALVTIDARAVKLILLKRLSTTGGLPACCKKQSRQLN